MMSFRNIAAAIAMVAFGTTAGSVSAKEFRLGLITPPPHI